jgi:hypothetical protein
MKPDAIFYAQLDLPQMKPAAVFYALSSTLSMMTTIHITPEYFQPQLDF